MYIDLDTVIRAASVISSIGVIIGVKGPTAPGSGRSPNREPGAAVGAPSDPASRRTMAGVRKWAWPVTGAGPRRVNRSVAQGAADPKTP